MAKSEQAAVEPEAAVEEPELEVLEEAAAPTAVCSLSAFRSTGLVDGAGEVVVASGEVVFDSLDIDDPDFALEVAGKLASAAYEAIRARAEAAAGDGNAVAAGSGPGGV